MKSEPLPSPSLPLALRSLAVSCPCTGTAIIRMVLIGWHSVSGAFPRRYGSLSVRQRVVYFWANRTDDRARSKRGQSDGPGTLHTLRQRIGGRLGVFPPPTAPFTESFSGAGRISVDLTASPNGAGWEWMDTR